ncbi:iron(III) transport system ATP-binding protein [Chitinivorax tropicus]|uniref:Iron(III) transport system ATP-binding protein n=1 Tax=Chitinivorax tropicus TaxID=714531 RepID=A0A840MNG7_9PROT|nr:ABC transporter ATP-binding protein [Chitinivorax tropicus]MBB5020188.1 iron(III) transport system ATP-binding protein [Chitinivorax tropicus]
MSQLSLKQISHAYGTRHIIDGLSLHLDKGDIGCLLGPSGCGKTTVLRCIAGFESITGGGIILNGQTVATAGQLVPPQQRKIGMVFQDYALFPHLTVAGNVAFGLHGMGKAEQQQRVTEMLSVVGLANLAQSYPHQLSGGQQQRVALARALAPQPAILLLDEPFSNLDVELRKKLSEEIRTILKSQQMTAILVTHDQSEAFAMADQIGIMQHGRIEQWDTPYNLYHRPANRFVADFIGEGVFLPGQVIRHDLLEIELGEIRGTMPETCCLGCTADVLIRPDDILHDDASPVKAKVINKAFRGAEFLYTLELESGDQVLSLVPSHHNHAVGEWIGIRLEIDHVIAFQR